MPTHKKKPRKGISRRDFLKGIGGGAVGGALSAHLLPPTLASASAQADSPPLQSLKRITFSLNGKETTIDVDPSETLLHLLREKLHLTGTKKVCDHGSCGGCTVLVDDMAVYSCLYPAFRVNGKNVVTIEGLSNGKELHPVQQAFIDHGAYQCGFCTPGFILATVALLRQKASPSVEEIRAGLSGNICRCGNQAKILAAVKAAASQKGGWR